MDRWKGFAFSVRRMQELVAVGMALLKQHGKIDWRRYQRVFLRHPQLELYGCIEAGQWGLRHMDPRCGLFFEVVHRPPRPGEDRSWQTPRTPAAVTAENCTEAMRRITNRQIAKVLRFLQSATVISREEYLCAIKLWR